MLRQLRNLYHPQYCSSIPWTISRSLMDIQNQSSTFLSFLASKNLTQSWLTWGLCFRVMTKLEQRRWLTAFGKMHKPRKKKFWTKWRADMGFNGIYGLDFMALPRWSRYPILSSLTYYYNKQMELIDIFIFTYFLRTLCQRKWSIRNIIIPSIRSLDFSYTWNKSLNGLMQKPPSSQIQ